jgi:hypothetical protein
VVVIRIIPHYLAEDPGDLGAGKAIRNLMQQTCQKLRQIGQKAGNRNVPEERPPSPIQVEEDVATKCISAVEDVNRLANLALTHF